MQPTLSLYRNTNAPAKRIQFLGVDFTGSVVELVLTNLVTSEEITLSTADDEISIDQDIVVWNYDQSILETLPVGNWTSFSVYRNIGETRELIGSGRISVIANGKYQIDNGTIVINVPGIRGPAGTVEIDSVVTLDPDEDAYIEELGTNTESVWRVGIPRGYTGVTPDIEVLSTTTLAAGQPATVSLDASSTPENPKLLFGVPQGIPGAAATITVAGTNTVSPVTPASVVNEGNTNAAAFRFNIPKGDKGDKGDTGAPGEPLVLVVSDTTDIGLGGWWLVRDYHGAATFNYLRVEMLVGTATDVTLAVRKNGTTVRSGIALGAGVTTITDLGLVLAKSDQVSVHREGGGTLTGPWVMLVQIDGRAT